MESIEDIRKQIRGFNNSETLRKLKARYESKSFLEILGVSRKEIAHSNFLAWLLNPSESHLLKDFALRKLLEIIILSPCKGDNYNSNNDLINKIILSNYKLSDVIINTEEEVKGGRVDIIIYANIDTEKIGIIIENKVYSKENNNQTEKYYQHYKNELKNRNFKSLFFVYLKPISNFELANLTIPECLNQNFIQLNYQSIVDSIITPALYFNITDKTKSILNEYLYALEGSINLKNNTIMAMSIEEAKLLCSFWEANEDLIIKAAEAKVFLAENEEEIKELNSIVKSIKKGKKKLKIALQSGQLKIGDVLSFKPQKKHIDLVNNSNMFKAEIIDHNTLKWLKNGEKGSPTSVKDMIVEMINIEKYTGSAATYWEHEGETIEKIANKVSK